MEKHVFYFWFGFLCVSISLGGILVSLLSFSWRERKGIVDPNRLDKNHFPAWLTGLFERIFFTILVAGHVEGSAAAIFTSLAAKQLCNLTNKPTSRVSAAWPNNREWYFSGLVFSFVNAFFAVVGGLFAAHWRRAELLLPGMSYVGHYGSEYPCVSVPAMFIFLLLACAVTQWIIKKNGVGAPNQKE
jgi:hypothetical protein